MRHEKSVWDNRGNIVVNYIRSHRDGNTLAYRQFAANFSQLLGLPFGAFQETIARLKRSGLVFTINRGHVGTDYHLTATAEKATHVSLRSPKVGTVHTTKNGKPAEVAEVENGAQIPPKTLNAHFAILVLNGQTYSGFLVPVESVGNVSIGSQKT